MNEDENVIVNDCAQFGQSQFKGKNDLLSHLHRWLIQFVALFIKGALVLFRRPLQLLLFLLLPSSFFLTFLIESAGTRSRDDYGNVPPSTLSDLGECDAYKKCIRVAFGPADDITEEVMNTFCDINDLVYGTDVIPFPTTDETQDFVATNLGRVQYTLLFSNQSLWETAKSQDFNYPIQALDKNMSYVIFYNTSHIKSDVRSEQYKVNFPMLVFQKTLEEAYLRNAPNRDFEEYNIDYGTIWGVPLNPNIVLTDTGPNATNITTACDLPLRSNMSTLGALIPWVITFSFMLMANVSFGLIAEERKKRLFTSLRRMGLIDSAYWASWFVLFELVLIVACALSLVTAVIVRPSSSALRELDLSLAFVVLVMCGTAFICLSFFLAALCSSASAETSITFAQFLIAMVTILSCFSPLCSYNYVENEETGDFECKLYASSYNTIYSKELLGNTFVQFLVWWMPFFHSSQVATDILSVIQYKEQRINFDNLGSPPMPLTYGPTSTDTYETKWVQWGLLMLMSNAIAYFFLAWFTAQVLSSDASEGRSLLSILLPTTVRRWLLNDDEVVAGDVRGEERLKSAEEKSVHAYKVSKTFSGVQALKEVSFTMRRGEVFVMLGHNGAGKSTLINIITGILAPTHGKVYLNGLDVERDAMDVQQTIGICSQDDLLWDNLTAREHMLLTAAFKGLRWGPELLNAVENVLTRVKLTDRANDFCHQFSGGMKRRLSVAMSTVGDVEILFLDEPTTGLDPLSRRRVWDTINWMKTDRVVVLTTHNMEEADYLADSIMIMHNGHVRAFGDPLFLKQTYGKGYQVNLAVSEVHSTEAQTLVTTVLPDASCAVDETSSSLTVTVPQNNLRGLPRLFTWLESSSRAAVIIKEWGISNTTLEQVFLKLCDLNTEINSVSSLQKESNLQELCPLCRVNLKATVFVRNLEGKILILPESVCWDCVTKNENFMLNEEDVALALEDGFTAQHRITDLLNTAQAKAEAATTQKLLALENSQMNEVLDTFEEDNQNEFPIVEDMPIVKSELQLVATQEHGNEALLGNGIENSPLEKDVPRLSPMEIDSADNVDHQQQLPDDGNEFSQDLNRNRADGAVSDQIQALFVKNIVLQSKQKCSNCCAVFFVALMFLMLYVMSLLFKDIESITVCDAGYLTDLDCSHETLVDHIFSGSWNDMVEDPWSGLDDDTVGPYGYTIKYYMVPSNEFRGSVQVFGASNDNYYNKGFPPDWDKSTVIWSSITESDSVVDLEPIFGLSMYARAIPADAMASRDAPNSFMYSNQLAVAESVEDSRDIAFPTCYDYAQDFFFNASSVKSVVQNYSNLFADGVFYCDQCKSASEMLNGSQIFFDGTVWVRESAAQCNEKSCQAYPYAFVNYAIEDQTWEMPYMGDHCPDGIEQISANSRFEYVTNTYRVMSYLNLLSNSMLHPSLESFDIQGGISPYGELNFQAQLISQILANILCVISMMLLNGFWPLAVWRLAHERSHNIVLMVHSSGLRKFSYMFGMLAFDMTISIVSGVGMIVFAVLLKLSRFEGAPVGYLVAIVLSSAFALNGGAQLMVIVSRKKATILPLLAPCLMVASVVTSSLLNILVYPADGDWKWPLSFYPYLAQGRALYILLVYHRGTPEVDTAIVLMMVFGAASLACTYALEMENEVHLEIRKLFYKRGANASQPRDDKHVVIPDGQQDDVENGRLGREIDIDVSNEMERAMAYSPELNAIDYKKAIVIQKMNHVFPNGFEAVKDLSLSLEYGECFGLLGPNGAGKSTTISVLSGVLIATGGKQYVAGCDLHDDPNLIHKYVGICPQFDVVWHDLTVAEHLNFQAWQRGVPYKLLKAEVQKAAIAVGLDGDGFDTKAGVLSGGMRRRLSIAMSIVGDPPIVFMDEPTTGLDPDNRQQVWRIIQNLKTPGRLILMTTHSMEEAEALCSRIGIMAGGELQCVGSAQHLKSKYGKGYTLTVNMLPTDDKATQNENLSAFVSQTLTSGDGVLLSSINQTRKYLLPKNKSTTISRIFKTMEVNKSILGIREWGLTMSTLEDVFISAVEHDNTI